MSLAAGTRLGTYEIVALLGTGGMGAVYLAKDSQLGRQIAVKVLPAEVATEPEWRARFEREARAVAALNHPNIVTLHSIEENSGVRFITMELVDGESLERTVVPGGLPLDRVLAIALPLADALAAAHAQRVVHRDLKPANVMLTADGRVKVLDFGLAKRLPGEAGEAALAKTATAPLTIAGQLVGTVAYMAPEQLRGEAADARTDLFAFGILLFELLTGRRPFPGATSAELIAAILNQPPLPLTRFRGDLPADLVHLVERCLEKDPARRVPSAVEVKAGLERVRGALESDAGARAAQIVPSIAVLPFDNRGRDADDEYFADGITEDVIAQLAKVRTLKVISRASVMPFKQRQESLREIAARLQVAHLLEGSVRRAGDRVRIVAQLVDAASGQNLWAETYDRRLTDIFEIQTEVALKIAGALQAELTPNERQRIRREPTRDVQAYELYLRGRQALVHFSVEGMQRSIEYFDQAIARDPNYAPAYVGLAMAYPELTEQGALDRERAGTLALSAGARAVALDPELGESHCALAYARLVFELDWPAAEAGFRRAIELSPGSAMIYDLYGRMCAGLERYDESLALLRQAHELDPLTERADLATTLLRAGRNEEAEHMLAARIEIEPNDARLRATLGWALFRQGRVGAGIAELERATSLRPNESAWLGQLGEAYGLSGQAEKAREVLRRLEDPARSVASPYHLAYVYTGLGELDHAMDCLEQAVDRRSGPVYGLKGSFLFAPLREHPRFVALLKRMRVS